MEDAVIYEYLLLRCYESPVANRAQGTDGAHKATKGRP